jgi:hypothetical protein
MSSSVRRQASLAQAFIIHYYVPELYLVQAYIYPIDKLLVIFKVIGYESSLVMGFEIPMAMCVPYLNHAHLTAEQLWLYNLDTRTQMLLLSLQVLLITSLLHITHHSSDSSASTSLPILSLQNLVIILKQHGVERSCMAQES